MKQSMSRMRRDDASVVEKWIRPVLIGLIAGVLCCLLVLMICAMIIAAVDMPQMAVTPMAIIAAVIASFVAGLVCARVSGKNGLVYGALCGITLYVLVMLAGFIALKDVRGIYALAKLLIMTGVGSIGGIVGVNHR